MIVALVLAAGRGDRLAADAPKAMVHLRSRPLVTWCLETLARVEAVDQVVLVGDETVLAPSLMLLSIVARAKIAAVVPGGATRQDSAARGLAAANPAAKTILVHDAARPLAPAEHCTAVAPADVRSGAAMAALPIADTLMRVAGARVVGTVEREGLWRAQTPQGFEVALFKRAHLEAAKAGFVATDDAALVERLGHPVEVVPGTESNRKITTAGDLAWAEAYIARLGREGVRSRHAPPRMGIGYDVHPFAEGRPLILGGVRIPHERGLSGHSDADALAHAVADALLGALALGDLGTHFPDTDPVWRGADSLELLARVRMRIEEAGYRVANVDATVIAETPRLAPHVDAMREGLARALSVTPDLVSVKATRHEGLGALGRGEGLAVLAMAVLFERESE